MKDLYAITDADYRARGIRLVGLDHPGPVLVVDLRYVAVNPHCFGPIRPWPRSRLRCWWLRRRGWLLYDGDGQAT